MLVLLVEYIFLTAFYGLYFNHQLHITITISSSSWWPSVSSFHILPLHLSFWLLGTTNQLLIFTTKFSPLPGLEPGTSPVPSRYATNWAILAWIKTRNLKDLVSVWKSAFKSFAIVTMQSFVFLTKDIHRSTDRC